MMKLDALHAAYIWYPVVKEQTSAFNCSVIPDYYEASCVVMKLLITKGVNSADI